MPRQRIDVKTKLLAMLPYPYERDRICCYAYNGSCVFLLAHLLGPCFLAVAVRFKPWTPGWCVKFRSYRCRVR